jgi:endonuclease-3
VKSEGAGKCQLGAKALVFSYISWFAVDMKSTSNLMTPAAIEAMFKRFAKAEPDPKTELIAPNPFCLLVAIILSAQATDVGVNRATPALFAKADSPKKMAALGVAGIIPFIKTIGLFRNKAKNVAAMSQKLLEEFGGKIPETREALMSLPGVGRKTANVWLNCVKGARVMAVDTHVERVANRMGLCRAKNALQTELALEKRIPKKWMQHAHHWLILHGRYVCKARKPECWRCLVSEWCGYKEKNLSAR